MNEKAMNLARFLPFWNSLDSVRRVHSDLEFAAIVFFALLAFFDVLAHRTENKTKERTFGGIGLWCFGIAVACELVAYPYGERNDTLSEGIITSLDQKSKDADAKAQSALRTSAAVQVKADAAKGDSEKAFATSSSAVNLASGARKEADSFEKDIVSAKTQAAKAESDFADSLQRVAQAEAELKRLREPRSLVNASTLIAALQGYRGTEYSFLAVYADQESIDLLKSIDRVLSMAGWTRVNPPGSSTLIVTISPGFTVPPSTQSGLLVQTESRNPESLITTPSPLLPAYIRAAVALKTGLASDVTPPQQELQGTLGVSPGDHAVVFITVGKKP